MTSLLPKDIKTMWPYYIAIASVFAAAVAMRIESYRTPPAAKPAPARRKPSPPKDEVDEAEPSSLVKAHALSGYAYLIARGKVLDIFEIVCNVLFFWRAGTSNSMDRGGLTPSGVRVGPPIWTGWQIFYTKRLYQRIVDCWNRPIAGQASSSIDVCDRLRSGTGDAAPLVMTGTTTRCLNLGSYNYLGFGGWEKHVTPAVVATLHEYGVSACSSRMECGDTPVHRALEQTVAEYLDKEAALVVGMGFATNSTLIPVLVDIHGNGKGVLVVSDTLNHSSIVEGVRGSGARVQPFVHNDMAQLESVLAHATELGQPNGQPWRKIIIIVEGIYSMEGQFCRLREAVAIKKKYRAYLYLDEAHSIGAVGSRGRGVTDHLGVPTADVDIMMGTFTKSFGSVGGYIAGSAEMVAALRRHAAGSLYAPAMSPPAAQQALSALRVIMGSDPATGDLGRRKIAQLKENSNLFRKGLLEMGCRVLGDLDSPIVPIMLYHPEKISGFSRNCLKRALAVVVVGFPATPLLLSRSRFCLAASHTRDELRTALSLVEEAAAETGVLYDRAAAKEKLAAGEELDAVALQRKHELQNAPLEAPGPMTLWQPEPLVPPTLAGETSAAESFAQAEADSQLKVPAAVDLRRTDFLQMAVDAQTKGAAEAALHKYGCGTCGPRGFYGTLDVHLELEKKLATFCQTEAAIIYSFGIATISSVVPAFVRKGDILFVDDGIHFTGAVGTRLARGSVRPFAHNDVAALEAALESQADADAKKPASKVARRFVLVEGLYANSGDIAPLPALLSLRNKYGFYLIVDDTLGFGALGATGRGTPELCGVPTKEIDLYVGSLEHALGSVGGFCAGAAPMVKHQVLSGSGYCFSASLPAYATCAAIEALRVIEAQPERPARLAKASGAMHKALHDAIAPIGHVQLFADAASPIAHVRFAAPARSTLSPAQQEALLRKVTAAVARSGDGVAVQLVRHSAQSHVQAPQPPSLRLTAHCDTRVSALAPAAAALAAALEAELAAPTIAAQLAAVAGAIKPSAEKPMLAAESSSSSEDLGAVDEVTARTVEGQSVKGNVGAALESEVPSVTVPVVLVVDAIRQTVRKYIQRQMELHELTVMPPLHKLRDAGLASPLARRLFTCGQLLGAETFYFFIIPMLSWSASPNARAPMFVTFFAVNIYIGNWLKNFFALARPLGAAGSTTAHSTSDFGWPSMYLVNAVALPFFAMRYWYGGFGSGTAFSEQNQLATFLSYLLAFVWVGAIAFARLFSGASSPADVQGGMLVGGVLVRAWLPICDSVNEWIVSNNSSFLGLPQHWSLLLIAVAALMVHPFTLREPRSWAAFGYSFKAIVFGCCFIIGSNGAATWGVNEYFLHPSSPTLALALTMQLTIADTARLLARNMLGFATLLALWRVSMFVSLMLEAQMRAAAPATKGPLEVVPKMLRNAIMFATMGFATSLGLPLAFRALKI